MKKLILKSSRENNSAVLSAGSGLLRIAANTIVVALMFCFASVINVKEISCQALQVPSSAKFVMLGPNDPNTAGGNNHWLTFGGGGNEGRWHIGIMENALMVKQPYNFNGGAMSLYFSPNGNVGIGSWSPNEKLVVNGNIHVTGTITYSDRRFKRDISPIRNLDNLFKVNSVQYMSSSEGAMEQLELFKQSNQDMSARDFSSRVFEYERQIAEKNADQRTYFGFIAQELRELYPELVYEDSHGYLAVNYTGLIPVLVDAIKELNFKIEKLEGKNRETMSGEFSISVLYQNNPNPFTDNTEIKFYIPDESGSASICIYDMVGSQIMKIDITSRGYSSVVLNGSHLKAGMYMYSLLVDGKEIDTKRMILTDK